MDEAPIGISISDPSRGDNPLIYVNDGFERLTGYDASAAVGRNCRFLQGEDTDPETVADLREAIDAREAATVELRNYRRDGTAFWNRVTVAPVTDGGGEVTHFVGFQRDVTDRKRDRQKLERAKHLLETVPSGVLRTEPTPDGGFDYVNPALVSMLGASSAAELRGRRVADFYVDPDERAALVDRLREADGGAVTHETELETLTGERIDVVIRASMSEDGTGTEHLYKVVQDVSERKEREQTLERYERLVENLPIGVYRNTPGPDGEFRFVNDAMVDLFEAESEAELLAHSVADLYVDPGERRSFSEQLHETEVVAERELKLQTLEGSELWGAITAVVGTVDGETIFDGVVEDITERKRYEQRLKEQRDNLDVLNQVLRHDVRNDLQLISAYASFLHDHVDDDGLEYVEKLQESAEHVAELTKSARNVADVMLSTEQTVRSVDLREVLDEEVDEVRSDHPGADVTVDGAIPAVSVAANDMLDSVFRNLLTNAIQHNDTSRPEVRVAADRRGESVVVRIADNGPGVPDAQKSSIFGKGEKRLESEGTGIGLYLVDTLVEMYGGDVRVEDNDPEGAVFGVELPVDDDATDG
jgi:PAS domain S-box-containing protein